MVKTNTPLLSLKSSGTLGGVLTTQRRGSATLVRSKPTPTYRYTLPQAYQRWLYEDYAYLWTQQSISTKALYRAAGVRLHLTAFQYWMKYQLTNLPDIAALWHLDEKSGVLATDFSRNANHATIIGASPAVGVIDGSFLFDGLNDVLIAPSSPSLSFGGHTITIEFFIYTSSFTNANYWVMQREQFLPWNYHFAARNTGKLQFAYWVAGIANYIASTANHSINKWIHLAVTYDGSNVIFYEDGVQLGAQVPAVGDIDSGISRTFIGSIWQDGFFPGWLDHIIIWNRVLDPTQLLMHAERRYPS